MRGLMEMGLGVTEIARRLSRHRTTIHRELERNRCVDGYRPDSAARAVAVQDGVGECLGANHAIERNVLP